MASVTSLGLHQPTGEFILGQTHHIYLICSLGRLPSLIGSEINQTLGLSYAIQEGLVNPDLPSQYTWQNLEEDELLVTPRCVIWSRGGIFKKSYKFDLEKEEVTQALFTTFPSVGPLAGKVGEARSLAIVVFLKTQAHVFFLSGTSHVIHLPCEVESVIAAPIGIIIQRKLRVELPAVSLQFPRVPPNSFVSSQPQPWSAASSINSTFSIADIVNPKQLPIMPVSTLKDFAYKLPAANDKNWPRLFSLSDPLAELGLVVTQSSKPGINKKRRDVEKLSTLDTAEEIVHVSRKSEFSRPGFDDSLTLALTLNRETSTYTVWKLSYLGEDAGGREKHRITSGTMSRRRSSFQPPTTGATTPVHASQSLRESFGGTNNINGAGQNNTQDDEARDKVLDFVSSLDPDHETAGLPRRKSRRVSSMLARQDLSTSHERSVFADLAAGHQHGMNRRGDSLGSQAGRTSIGGFGATNLPGVAQSGFNNSISSFLDAPVDGLLDELRAGGDFEGFHNMGLDDKEFDALRQEIVLTKVCNVPAEHSNVRYSSQHIPAKNQCKIFTLTAPPSAADDQQGYQIVVCILDPNEKRMMVLNLIAKAPKAIQSELLPNPPKADASIPIISLGPVMRAKGVIDACRIDDGPISRILVLSQTPDGFGELSLQAPWSVLMKVSLPGKFAISNIRNLSHDTAPRVKREGGFKRVLSQGPGALVGLRNSKPRGLVDIIDDEGKTHQLRIRMQPQNPQVRIAIELCGAVVTSTRGGEGILVAWWNVMQWLETQTTSTEDGERSALVITIFLLVLGLSNNSKTTQSRTPSKRKPRSGFLRSSSGAHSTDLESWDAMMAEEAPNGNSLPPWAQNRGWQWLQNDFNSSFDAGFRRNSADLQTPIFFSAAGATDSFAKKHVKLTRDFLASTSGPAIVLSCLPTSANRNPESRASSLRDILIGLHLLCQEQKLDTMNSDSSSTGTVNLIPVLSQMARWLGWKNWVEYYDAEETSMLDSNYDTQSPIRSPIREPFTPPLMYDWIQTCLVNRAITPFPDLVDLVQAHSCRTRQDIQHQCLHFTPRTFLFKTFFSKMRENWSSAEFVEALAAAGVNSIFLETLPEAVLAALQEWILQCQTEPPTTWSKSLLAIVGREDVNILLSPGQRSRHTQTSLLAPSHEANYDVRTICASTSDLEPTGSFDGSAEVERLAISRAIFKDDRRVNEAQGILNTFRPTIARVQPQPQWSESELLEAQKEHVQMIAYRTLAIPSGRGLLYFSARIPLLTQRFPIGGFSLNCIMKPDNNSVSVDKNAFGEEKICWAFFHAGVSSGLSISRDAKGIDTSWILYNKPATDLSNRHAGFLLALGLNGHLKAVAKWVAFKYLTPKHTMTSIGLLLGLAASYIGTMDSLVTRLLSVHVTRMLPPGAAELNLSPLVQTTGIMGIGLLYCSTQHRRMSEVMVSEIEHIDTETEEDPLRNEGYRLAAGFALGYINLGKGSDLKGLHDMRLTERLLALAAGSKKVDIVHVLDKATAGAVVALILIFMKSENQILARKIDVPESLLQFDYVRPDIFLLRTLAKHLIMWTGIEPSFEWVANNLPEVYRSRSKLEVITELTSEDLPFYNIITGLCFSIALRFAGSANIEARDVLLHYLDQLMRICLIRADNYDRRLTRNTARNCLDLVALAVATVMAGTGDLLVFRRLRSLHGRDDADTPYGSHLAAHLAIGALFLGSGTFTVGTSNLAIASLIVAFYPLFPSNVQDNRSHLQAFRHFWVLAAEARCLVARDIDTNQVVSLPITVTLRDGTEIRHHTPTLLPELDQINEVRSGGTEYWHVVLDFEHNAAHVASFKSTQTIYVRKRPAHDASSSAFQTTLQALNDIDGAPPHALEWLFELDAFKTLTKAERALVLPPDGAGKRSGLTETVVDTRLILENATLESGNRDRLMGLRLLFEWAEKQVREKREPQWVRMEVVERLKARVWMMGETGA